MFVERLYKLLRGRIHARSHFLNPVGLAFAVQDASGIGDESLDGESFGDGLDLELEEALGAAEDEERSGNVLGELLIFEGLAGHFGFVDDYTHSRCRPFHKKPCFYGKYA